MSLPGSDKTVVIRPPFSGEALPRKLDVLAVAAIVLVTLAVFYPVTRNGFLVLGFDDDALILDNPVIREFSWPNLLALATQVTHAHYVPLTLLSLSVDYHFWGLNPCGYHFSNLLLHATAAVLFYLFLRPIVPSARVALLAAAIFAVHPLQMEAVSLAVQRKTVLAGVFWFLTLILYQRWRGTGGRGWYGLCLLSYLAAALAKPAVVSLPFVLLLYDDVVRRCVALRPILPFFAIACFSAWMTRYAHAAVGANYPLHGGNLLTHLLMVSRVALENVDAAILPLRLSPVYYYPPGIVYRPVNFLALALILAVCLYVTAHRHHYRWSFFCLWWFALGLLPESNLVPLAWLRADRFLYFALPAFALWVACGWERLIEVTAHNRWRPLVWLLGPAAVALLGVVCYQSAAVWRDDVSAWTRVVERHSWCAAAHKMLGRAYYDKGDLVRAEGELTTALRLSDRLAETYLYLAKVWAQRGATGPARAYLQRFLDLEPGNPEGLELLSTLPAAGGA
jgi:tetratricopeptide (TPR) repeat protein